MACGSHGLLDRRLERLISVPSRVLRIRLEPESNITCAAKPASNLGGARRATEQHGRAPAAGEQRRLALPANHIWIAFPVGVGRHEVRRADYSDVEAPAGPLPLFVARRLPCKVNLQLTCGD